jgi:hypothetical protein
MDSFVDHVEIPHHAHTPPLSFSFHSIVNRSAPSHRRRPPLLSADQTTMPSSSDESMDPAQMLINGLKVRFVG